MVDATSNSKQQLNESKKVTTGEGACHAHGEADCFSLQKVQMQFM
jgi:hypothetical protein